jgi:hypothetical protein
MLHDQEYARALASRFAASLLLNIDVAPRPYCPLEAALVRKGYS